MQGRAGRQISRPRPCLSCSTCRRRKVRCGRESPECYNCVRLREPCHYDPFQTKQAAPHNPTQDASRNETPANAEKSSKGGQENSQGKSPARDDTWNEWPRNSLEIETSRAEVSEGSMSITTAPADPVAARITPMKPKARHDLRISYMPPLDSTSKSRSAPLTPSIHSAASSTTNFGYSWDMDAIVNETRGFTRDLTSNLEDLENAESRRKRQRQSPILQIGSDIGADISTADFASSFHFQTGLPRPQSPPAFADETIAQPGYLAQRNQTRPQFVESTFWALIKGHESLCEDLLRYQSHNVSANSPFAPVDPVGMAKLLRSLPSRAVCDALLLSYIIGVCPILPLVHISTFREDYTQFWSWAGKNDVVLAPSPKLIQDPTFFPLLFAILFCGAIAAPAGLWNQSPFQALDRDSFLSELEAACCHSLKICQYNEYPTLNTLVASLLCHSCCKQNIKRLEASSFTRQAIRSAQNLGLHQESNVEASDTMKDLRRRIWRHIMWLDVQDSIMNGSRISCSGFDDQDRDFATNSLPFTYPTPPIQTNDERSSAVTHFIRGIHETTRFEHSLMLALQYTQRSLRHTDFQGFLSKMKKLHLTLDLLISKIPANGIPEKGYIPARLANASPLTDKDMYCDTGAGPTVFGSWARIKLTMMKTETAILLQKAALADADVGTKQGRKKWQSIVQLCVHYLRNFLQLTRVPAFSPYHWFLSACQHPLQPIVIILIYLQYDPSSPKALVTRYFIDEVIDVFTSHDISPASNSRHHAPATIKKELSVSWEFIKALRAKLDSSISTESRSVTGQHEQIGLSSEQISPPQSISGTRDSNDGFTAFQDLHTQANLDPDGQSSWPDNASWDDFLSAKADTPKLDLPIDPMSWTNLAGMQTPTYSKGWNTSTRDTRDTSSEGQTGQPMDHHHRTITNATTHEGDREKTPRARQDGERSGLDTDSHSNTASGSDFLSTWIASEDLGFESLLDGV